MTVRYSPEQSKPTISTKGWTIPVDVAVVGAGLLVIPRGDVLHFEGFVPQTAVVLNPGALFIAGSTQSGVFGDTLVFC